MEASELREHLDELFDNDLMFHGFTDYMRDYELIVYQSADPRSEFVPRHLRFLFRFCPEVAVRSSVRPEVWSRSLGDHLLDTHHVTRESSGYVWGVRCQLLYPGATIVQDSERAKVWGEQIGLGFHEVLIEGNAQSIRIVFSDLVVEEVADGYSPYQVADESVAVRYASQTKQPLNPSDT